MSAKTRIPPSLEDLCLCCPFRNINREAGRENFAPRPAGAVDHQPRWHHGLFPRDLRLDGGIAGPANLLCARRAAIRFLPTGFVFWLFISNIIHIFPTPAIMVGPEYSGPPRRNPRRERSGGHQGRAGNRSGSCTISNTRTRFRSRCLQKTGGSHEALKAARQDRE